jgi:phenylacetate-coenzyme A ligase PaaK-like adenylate-forming protein
VGLIGYECPGQDGYHVTDDIVVQVCDPATGEPLPDGQPGEVVVTNLDPVWPLVRFGTGDASFVIGGACPCGDQAPKLAPLLGRTGQSIKVREIFVYPRHMDEIRARVDGARRVQGTVRRRGGRDEVDLLVEVEEGADGPAVEAAVRDACTALTRLRAGNVELAAPGAIPADAGLLVNEREEG